MQATFHSLRGEKSALLLLSTPFSFQRTPVYVPARAVEGKEPGDILDIPDNFKLVPLTGLDEDNNEVIRTTKNGIELKTLVIA